MARSFVSERFKGEYHEFGVVHHTYESERNRKEDYESITQLMARLEKEGGWLPISTVPYSSLAGSWTQIYVKRQL